MPPNINVRRVVILANPERVPNTGYQLIELRVGEGPPALSIGNWFYGHESSLDVAHLTMHHAHAGGSPDSQSHQNRAPSRPAYSSGHVDRSLGSSCRNLSKTLRTDANSNGMSGTLMAAMTDALVNDSPIEDCRS